MEMTARKSFENLVRPSVLWIFPELAAVDQWHLRAHWSGLSSYRRYDTIWYSFKYVTCNQNPTNAQHNTNLVTALRNANKDLYHLSQFKQSSLLQHGTDSTIQHIRECRIQCTYLNTQYVSRSRSNLWADNYQILSYQDDNLVQHCCCSPVTNIKKRNAERSYKCSMTAGMITLSVHWTCCRPDACADMGMTYSVIVQCTDCVVFPDSHSSATLPTYSTYLFTEYQLSGTEIYKCQYIRTSVVPYYITIQQWQQVQRVKLKHKSSQNVQLTLFWLETATFTCWQIAYWRKLIVIQD